MNGDENGELPTIPAGENPLTQANYKDIQKGVAAIQAGLKHCEWAEGAGIPCGDLRADFDYITAQYEQLKKVFFPGKR